MFTLQLTGNFLSEGGNMYELKSGKEIVEEFYQNIDKISGLNENDKKILDKIKTLYYENKLSDTKIKNLLDEIIEERLKK